MAKAGKSGVWFRKTSSGKVNRYRLEMEFYGGDPATAPGALDAYAKWLLATLGVVTGKVKVKKISKSPTLLEEFQFSIAGAAEVRRYRTNPEKYLKGILESRGVHFRQVNILYPDGKKPKRNAMQTRQEMQRIDGKHCIVGGEVVECPVPPAPPPKTGKAWGCSGCA